MDISIIYVLAGLGAVTVGIFLGYFARQSIAQKMLTTAEGKARKALEDAETSAKEIIVSAKNKAMAIIEDAKSKEQTLEKQLEQRDARLEKREELLNRRMEDLERTTKEYEQKKAELSTARGAVEELRAKEMVRLERIAGLSQVQARDVLLQLAEEEHKEHLAKKLAILEKDGMDQLEERANNLMAQVMQRYARSHAAEFSTSVVAIPSEDLKGKIIGKEGRNVRALEKLTGVEFIIDESPDSIVISGFDPVRREVAKVALEKLVADGRIHPARIEETVAQAEKEIDKRIREAGEAAAYEAGIAGLHPKLLVILGRLRYRTSYRQNVLLHSLEVSFIAGALAAELGLNVAVAKKAGLLHDIGKAVSHEVEGTHVNIGMKILEKFGVGEDVIHAMRSHHEEYPFATPESYVVTAADAISASRPGARKDTAEQYIKRMEELETAATNFPGVEKCYAISAGREIRVFVRPEQVDDLGAMKLARSIADRIEQELKYPGEIKVVVMRETRSVEFAR